VLPTLGRRLAGLHGLAFGLAVALSACGGGGSGGGQQQPFGLEGSYEVTGLGFDFGASQPGSVSLVPAYPSVGANPLEILPIPGGSGRLVAIDKSGFAVSFVDAPETVQADTYFNLSGLIQQSGGEAGLLGLCFDPDYDQNGRLYVFYSASSGNRSVLARLIAVNGIVQTNSLTELLSIPKTNDFHNGGKLAFGPDGYLYVSVGDDGVAANAQDLTNLHGKILRIDGNGNPAPGNPFSSTPGAREEIWALGLRNVWRFSFDPKNGELWAADVGELSREEIDLILPGRNYGWPAFEGSAVYDPLVGLDYSATEPPLYEYDHSVGQAIIGGFVYRGNLLPSLNGAYLYADAVVGRLWALTKDSQGAVTNTLLATGLPFPVSLGQTAAGEPRIGCLVGGQIYGLEEENGGGGGAPVVPNLLSQTGIFSDLSNLTPREGFVPYAPNAPFWSDGSVKQRWIGLPPGGNLGFSANGNWTFPVGTVTVKHFELNTSSGPRRLETRVLYRTAAAWEAYSYRWNDQQTDAERVDVPDLAYYTVPDSQNPGSTLEQPWVYLASGQCFQCHTAASGYALGLRSSQLNGDFDYALAQDNQLRAWNHIGWFSSDIGSPAQYPALVDPYDPESGSLDQRARSYLESNCANCHQPGGPTALNMDLRASTAVPQMNTHGIAPLAGNLGIANAKRVDPFETPTSILYQRMLRLDLFRMPPVGSYSFDVEGLQLIGAWIEQGAQ
jgi:uncharacterized repeat protein (TIGR03806 family)